MAGRVSVYDFRQVVCTFGAIYLQGFAEGDALTSEFDSPQETATAGADGEVIRVRNASRLATVTVRLQRGSIAAALLRDWLSVTFPPLDQVPFIIKDIGALQMHYSDASWIVEPPAPAYGADAPVEEWKFKLANFNTNVPLLGVTG